MYQRKYLMILQISDVGRTINRYIRRYLERGFEGLKDSQESGYWKLTGEKGLSSAKWSGDIG